MTIKPILFSTAMVQGILEDRKSQTRRIIKPQPDPKVHSKIRPALILDGTKRQAWLYAHESQIVTHVFPKYQEGDIMWVRETWHPKRHNMPIGDHFEYKATAEKDGNPIDDKWKPSIFMPKAACRIFLEVTKVRVERLQDISEEDAKAEGSYKGIFRRGPNTQKDEFHLESNNHSNHLDGFKFIWFQINGKESWKENPWVWVYDFKRVEKPENFK